MTYWYSLGVTHRLAILLVVLAACGGSPDANTPHVSKEPISVRGWIAGGNAQMFQSTNVWVDNAPYVSGGVAENGAFLLLDVPPGNVTIEFSAPGPISTKLALQNIPGNADVFVPGLVLRNGAAGVEDPKAVQVRMAAHIEKPQVTGTNVIVAGAAVPVINTPLNAMTDRHDYPNPPARITPLATVK